MSNWVTLHLQTGADGISCTEPHFATEISAMNFAPPAPPMLVAQRTDVHALTFVEIPCGWHGGWHPSPQKQWVICLGGEMEYQAGDGTRFKLTAGSCIFTSDTWGQGHDSWNAGNEPVRLAVIQVE
jgi:quercetin dioxygenase-like cupin family protein